MTTELATLSRESLQVLKDTICKGSTDTELSLYIEICKEHGFSPFSRHLHPIKRWDSKLNREVMIPMISIDGLRLIADRTGKYDGQVGPHWCGKDGVWRDVWLEKEKPFAARVCVYKKGIDKPFVATALWSEYAQYGKNGLSQMWDKFSSLMIAKVAESLALRKAFPFDIAGLYSEDEIEDTPPAPTVNPTQVLEVAEVLKQDAAIPAKRARRSLPEKVEKESQPLIVACESPAAEIQSASSEVNVGQPLAPDADFFDFNNGEHRIILSKICTNMSLSLQWRKENKENILSFFKANNVTADDKSIEDALIKLTTPKA